MQLKLDSLCEEMVSIQDTVGTKLEKTKTKQDRSLTSLVEQEERRMSDLSDFCWSVASSFDNQIPISSLASEQEVYNLQKECEEKDATIEELLSAAGASRIADTTRITELEELVKRKNLVISKLKKDIAVLERIVDLTRSRRDLSALSSNSNKEEVPVMVNNILFDMSSSSSSSSDSESPCASKEHPFEGIVDLAPKQERAITEKKKSRQMFSNKVDVATVKHTKKKTDITGAVRPRQIAAASESFKKTRRSTRHEPKSVPQRRWL